MITQEMRPVYVTEDGAEFADKLEAQKHELGLCLRLYDIDWRDTDADEVAGFIMNNWSEIKREVGLE